MTLPRRTLLLGGARSGKSGHAEHLAAGAEDVRYVATGRRRPADADWDARIEEHRVRRPATWTTVESTTNLPQLIVDGTPGVTLVDDLGTWLTHTIDDRAAWDSPRGTIAAEIDALVEAVAQCTGTLLLVTPEVGLSVVPHTRSGRLFQDEIGALNSRLAEVCDDVVLVVAGLPLTLKCAGVPPSRKAEQQP
ncbi:bifunctional adenosylcobinamide kinase/adenosylcobinamide-phosphate guanylyltransferase [Rhodococcus sp. H36-A4]|uniref:bifunctional adenosylcobinamide kinase/adenosylcobinamide-phosphate guanylyltransferase n=1 Tax=Rhodococcus sp. H36-A4 TaxID=3004353 RepID=UPI0022AFBF28|nr:bifunctional adenosylcobinamide kinase/adenosylcobinamide-phosphate guanylyltransferase [Rhodococcus sp. H36-A4]MCZ4078846.1 bifunctional adenosylcobinamide kinase/adenosylcobinamide-phosphate guanylyltransferase [Rhodococcus sp. H36-A4]